MMRRPLRDSACRTDTKVYHWAEFPRLTDPDQGKGGPIPPQAPPPLGPWAPLALPEVQALFAPADFPWWVAGGHALDLFVGHPTRPHTDMDVSILRRDAPLLRQLLAGWDLHGAHAGILTPWTTEDMEPPTASIWCRTAPGRAWCLQVMLDEGSGAEWVCHRHGEIRLALPDALARSPEPQGAAYLRPELQLLLKAEDSRPKDDADFAVVFPLLGPAEAQWLAGILRRLFPDHRWLDQMPIADR
jgi:hypothetical protein